MSVPREPTATVHFVDQYCAYYRDLFPDVRSFEYFKYLHLGLIAELPRKSLPAMARAVGLDNEQPLHHFLANSPWKASELRQQRLELITRVLHGRPLVLCIDETGDRKKGKTTDYVARQYIGNLGKIDNGLVSVNAYGLLGEITIPLVFEVFKPLKRLKDGDCYRSKPQLAVQMIQALQRQGLQFEVVLADSLYGESGDFIEALTVLGLRYVVAIRENHGVWLGSGQRVRATRWRRFDRLFSNGEHEERFIREIIFGRRHDIRYYQITTDTQEQPPESTWWIMTNLTGALHKEVGNLYGLRTWIEYGFKQSKDELGWADFRLTHYADIEKWWELVYSAYGMVSLHALGLTDGSTSDSIRNSEPNRHPAPASPSNTGQGPFQRHKWWDAGRGWKSRLNNLRLIIQPYVYYCLLAPWLQVFAIPCVHEGLLNLSARMNEFQGFIPV